ncbi:hypothetical protein HWV62_19629 [Athelia sp. TMB]|nr:hypothetical protein HWV62_19629 [Athelia sp. TMB]
MLMHPAAIPVTRAQPMITIMTYARVPAAELRARGIPENVIRFVETNRSILERNIRPPVRQSGASGSERGPYLPLGSYEIARGDLRQAPQTDLAGRRPQGEASTPERAKYMEIDAGRAGHYPADPNELRERGADSGAHLTPGGAGAEPGQQPARARAAYVHSEDADARGRSGKQETAASEASGCGGRADGTAAEFWGEPWDGLV